MSSPKNNSKKLIGPSSTHPAFELCATYRFSVGFHRKLRSILQMFKQAQQAYIIRGVARRFTSGGQGPGGLLKYDLGRDVLLRLEK